MQHRDLAFAAEQHVTDTLARTPILAPAAPEECEDVKALHLAERILREQQSVLSEKGKARAVGCLEDALREVVNARRSLETDRGDER